MADKIKVRIQTDDIGHEFSEKVYEEGISLLKVSKDVPQEFDAMAALVDGKLAELANTLNEDCTVRFLSAADQNGRKTYERGLIFVLIKAVYDVFSDDMEDISVEYSIGDGIYCEVKSKGEFGSSEVGRVKERMLELIEADLPFEKSSIRTEEAIPLFHKFGMFDKEKLFQYRRVSSTNLYRLEDCVDYFYGYMPYSTGVLRYFDLLPYEAGMMLVLPDAKEPSKVRGFVPRVKLFHTLKLSNDWGKTMGVQNVADLNDAIARGEFSELILVQEALQEKKIGEIAQMIKDQPHKKFIMIAGPSSSGKTTFSHRLSIQLRTLGLKPHPIAVDDYFKNREDTPKDEEGNFNFECLEAIDVEQFNKDMLALLDGREVEIPSFNFKLGKREYKGNKKKLGANDILVLEGIHGLNDGLSYSLPNDSKFKIYISALTQLNIDGHNRIPTTDGRLIRRLVRDFRTRGASAGHTLSMWGSVRRGETENIFPYQEQADVMFNSALIYELAVLKQYAEPLLFGISKDSEEYVEAKRLLKFLDYFLGVSTEEIPKNSLIREFIGGSCFKV